MYVEPGCGNKCDAGDPSLLKHVACAKLYVVMTMTEHVQNTAEHESIWAIIV